MSWPLVALGDVAQVIGGSTPRRGVNAFWGDGHFWATPTDLPMPGEGILDLYGTKESITDEGLHSSSTNLLPIGAVLYSTRATIGKLAIAGVPVATNQGFNNFIAGPAIQNRYLAYALQYFTADIECLAGSTTFKEVSRSKIRAFKIPLPPPSEQRRIVEILDQADALRKLRRDADAKAARILPALFLQMFGDPGTWEQTRPLGELVTMQSGGTPSKAVPEFWDGTIPWVSPKDMKRDEIADAEDHVSDAALQQSAIHMVPSGSILIVVRGMILAHDVPIAITRASVTINQDMKALTLTDDQMTPLFLFAAMRAQTPRLHAEVSTAAHGTKRIETPRLVSLPILIAAPADVAQFTSEYESVLKLDKVRATVAPRLDTLFSTLLQRAFSGQLTAQWRQAHLQELLSEMQEQARLLSLPTPETGTPAS